MNLNNILLDLETVKEAINNGDDKDAIQMLEDIQEDLKIILLTC